MFGNVACRAVEDMHDAVVVEPNRDSTWGGEHNNTLLKVNRFRVIDFEEPTIARFQSECEKWSSF